MTEPHLMALQVHLAFRGQGADNVVPTGTAMWVGRALHGHTKPIMVSALSVNLQPRAAWADAWIAVMKVD